MSCIHLRTDSRLNSVRPNTPGLIQSDSVAPIAAPIWYHLVAPIVGCVPHDGQLSTQYRGHV
eukprot:1934834-Rhodomonas_salina.1